METADYIQCPYCGHMHDYNEFLEVGDMSGEFEMECEKCEKSFDVDFYSIFHFTAKQK
jgi:transcription elongation factor Elf1